jgi:Tol biopolymer transport system component
MAERTVGLLLRSVALAAAASAFVSVSAQRLDQREIVFDSRLDGSEIWAIKPDGSGLRRLTHSPTGTSNQDPRWSPDGRQIAFVSNRYAPSQERPRREIYVMNRDGSDVQRLTSLLRDCWSPEWSPDGRRIAFVSDEAAAPAAGETRKVIYVMDANGSNIRRLMTDQTFSSQAELTPAWSPDGTRIAFTGLARGQEDHEIYILELETSTLTQLTDNNDYDAHVAWSPDGQHLSFDSDRDPPYGGIYVMRPDGSQVVRLTNHPRMENAARWSRDGQRLAFNSTRDYDSNDLRNMEIYVMNRDGSGLRRLTNNSVKDTHPDW